MLTGTIAWHQAHQPDRIGRTHDTAQRLVHSASAQVGQCLGHHLDALGHRQQQLDLGVIQDENLHIGTSVLFPSGCRSFAAATAGKGRSWGGNASPNPTRSNSYKECSQASYGSKKPAIVVRSASVSRSSSA